MMGNGNTAYYFIHPMHSTMQSSDHGLPQCTNIPGPTLRHFCLVTVIQALESAAL
ncbi:hypothetical protein STEG23_005917, partial [Scotinomys teguina]